MYVSSIKLRSGIFDEHRRKWVFLKFFLVNQKQEIIIFLPDGRINVSVARVFLGAFKTDSTETPIFYKKLYFLFT